MSKAKVDIKVKKEGYRWFGDKGCGVCIHEKVCGLWSHLYKIVNTCGPFRIQFYCDDFLQEGEK